MIKLINLYKNFGKLRVLENINTKINDGEFTVILGPNGCGKTTLLRMISNLDKPTKGQILVDGKIGFLFQEPTLFPWRNVEENIKFGLEVKNVKEYKDIIKKYIKLLGLEKFENYYPNELSSGMKQKVSIARTLVTNPSVLLMDEPFSMLDFLTRKKLQKELVEVWHRIEKTILFVTHDVDEALYLADRIIVFTNRPAKIVKEFRISTERTRRLNDRGLKKNRDHIIKLLGNY